MLFGFVFLLVLGFFCLFVVCIVVRMRVSFWDNDMILIFIVVYII